MSGMFIWHKQEGEKQIGDEVIRATYKYMYQRFYLICRAEVWRSPTDIESSVPPGAIVETNRGSRGYFDINILT